MNLRPSVEPVINEGHNTEQVASRWLGRDEFDRMKTGSCCLMVLLRHRHIHPDVRRLRIAGE